MAHTGTGNGKRPMPPSNLRRADCGAKRVAGLCLATALYLATAGAGAAVWNFEPRVAAGVTWVDNVAAAPSGAEADEWITELNPGFSLSMTGGRSTLQLEYDAQALWYNDNSDLDDVYHQADGTGNFVLAPEALFLDAFIRNTQQNIDPAGRISSGNFLQTDNRTNALVYGLSPYYQARWGRWAESLLRYQYTGVRYSDTDPGALPVQDSDSSAMYATLGTPQDTPGWSWLAAAEYTRTEFETAREFEYGQASLELGIPVGLRTRLLLTGGLESDVQEDFSAGGFDESFWSVGVAWNPTELQSLEVRVGERYYGSSFEVRWSRRGTRGEIGLDYTETPTTSSGVLGGADAFQSGFDPAGLPTLDTRPFLSKRMSARASYRLVRTTFNASVYSDSREYLDGTTGGIGDDDVIGARLSADWNASVRTQVGLVLNWEEREFSSGTTGDDSLEAGIQLSRQLNRTLSAILRGSHFTRDSDTTGDYSVNLVSLLLSAQF